MSEAQILPNIADDDPEVVRVLRSMHKPVYPMAEVIDSGPHGRTIVYQHSNDGLLSSFVSNGRRFVLAVDFARYLIALKRTGDAQSSRHHLAKPSNRPAHDPKRQRAA